MNGEMPLRLLLVVVTDRIAVINRSHPVCQTCQIRHRLSKRSLTTPTMSQEDNVTNLVSCENIHRKTLLIPAIHLPYIAY